MFDVLATSVAPKARRTAYWRGLAVSALIGLGGFGAAVPSFAANALLTVTVKPIPSLPACPASAPCFDTSSLTAEASTVDPDGFTAGEPISNVSLSRTGTPSFTGYIAYDVTVSNETTNVINQVFFGATTKVIGAVGVAPLVGTAPSPCTKTDPSTVSCPIGQLRSSTDSTGSSVHFVLLFQTPIAGTQLDLNWNATFSNGNSPNVKPATVDNFNGTVYAKLITGSSAEVANGFNSYVPTGTFTFFTGTTGKASPTNNNLWTTTVTIPATDPTTANVIQSLDQQSCSSDLSTCNFSTLTIPGTFASLTITLRRDASTIKSGAKIENAIITYSKIPFDPNNPNNGYDPQQVLLCSTVVGGAPTLGHPCMDVPKAYTKKITSDPELLGDWEFVIHALDNGSYRG